MNRASDGADVPAYVYRCKECGGLLGAHVADLNDPRMMRDALRFRRDAEKRGRAVEVVTVGDVRTSRFCPGTCPGWSGSTAKKVGAA